MLLPGEDAAEMVAEEKIWQLLSRWLTPDQGSIWRAATYRFYALVAGRRQKGREVIVGDGPQHTPTLIAKGHKPGPGEPGNLGGKDVRGSDRKRASMKSSN